MKTFLSKSLLLTILLSVQCLSFGAWAQDASNTESPSEQWEIIFERNYQNKDAQKAEEEREEKWSDAMRKGYRRWMMAKSRDLDRRYEVAKVRADEEERAHNAEKVRLDKEERAHNAVKVRLAKYKLLAEYATQTRIIRNIMEHRTKYLDQINSERVQLQNRLQENQELMGNRILLRFCEDYVAGKPISKEHLLAIQQWIATVPESKTD